MKVGELLVVMTVDFSQYEKDLDKAEKRAQKTGSNIGDIFKNALSFTLGMGIFEAVKSGFKAVASSVLDFNSMMERATIGFTTMLGSAQKAQDFLDKMGKFASSTPFEYPDLLNASQRLMAMGFSADEVLPTLKAVGDAMAGMGKGANEINGVIYALGQMRMAGRVNAQDMMQLVNQGVQAWQILAEAMGKTTAEVRKMSEQGLIPADYAVNALINGMEKRFPNMMKNMENTWQGVTSTIKDVWRMTIGAMTQGLFKGITGWLQKVRDFAQEFYNAFQQGGIENAIRKMFGPNVLADFQMISAALRTVWQIIVGVFNTIKSNWNIFGPIIKGALIYFVSFKLVTIVVNAATKAVALFRAVNLALAGASTITSGVLGLLSRAVGIYRVQLKLAAMEGITLTGVLAKLRVAIYAVWTAIGPIGWAVLAISALIVAGIALYKNWDKVRYYGLQAWGALKVGIAYVAYAIVGYYKLILGWIPAVGKALSDMQNKIKASIQSEKSIMAQRKSTYQAAGDELKQVKQAQDKVSQAANNATKQTQKNTDAMKQQNKAANDNLQSFDEVHTIMQETADAAGEVPDMQMPGLETGSIGLGGIEMPDLREVIGNVSSIGDVFSNTWEKVKTSAINAWNAITTFLDNTWTNIVNKTRLMWEPLANFFSALWEGIKTITLAVWNIIVFILATVWFGVVEIAKGVWSIIGPFFTMLWEGIKTVATTVWNGLSTFLTTIWNGIVIAAKTVWGVIGPFFTALWEGVKAVFTTIWNAISPFLTTIWNEIKTVALTVWNLIKVAMTNPILAAKENIENTSTLIKGYIIKTWSVIKNSISNIAKGICNNLIKPFLDAKNFISDILSDAFNWGKNLVQNIINGINSMIDKAKNAVSNVASTIANFLGFHSPAKEGPGSDADKWAPNLINMFAQGIYSNIGNIQAAVNTTAGVLQGLNVQPKLGLSASGGYGTIASTTPGIHLHIGTLIADDYGLKKLEQKLREFRINEEQRLGADRR